MQLWRTDATPLRLVSITVTIVSLMLAEISGPWICPPVPTYDRSLTECPSPNIVKLPLMLRLLTRAMPRSSRKVSITFRFASPTRG